MLNVSNNEQQEISIKLHYRLFQNGYTNVSISIYVLWNVDLLLGNDSDGRSYTTAIAR